MAAPQFETRSLPLPRVAGQKVLVGGADGPPLVWLHGISRPGAGDPLLHALASRHRVIAPLMPGVDDLDELEGLADIHDLALHYDGLLSALGLGRVALAGHSFGAMLAAEIAAHVPGRVDKLVLFSPLGLWRDDAPVDDLFARPHAEALELVWKGAAEPPTDAIGAQTATAEALIELANTLGGMAKYLWPIPDKGLDRRLYRIAAPTLIVFGEHDAYAPASYGEVFASAIAGARARLVPGGHMAAYENPGHTADLIEAFLT